VIQEKDKNQLSNWEIVSVNPSDKKWTWKDFFCLWGINIQSIIGFSLITSLYLVYELDFFVVFVGCLIGSFFVYIFSNLIGKPSQKHGIPFVVFLRTSIGIHAAKYLGLLRGLVGIFMFGVQTYFLSKAFSYLIRISIFSIDKTILDQDIFLTFLLGLNIIDGFAFLLAILLQIFLFSRGHIFNRFFVNFSTTVVYLGMIFFSIAVISDNSQYILDSFVDIVTFKNIFVKSNIIPLLTVAGTIFAYFSIVIVNFGDYSRYAKDENHLKLGNLSLFINLIVFSFFSVLIVLGSDIILNKNLENMERILTNPTDIIGKFDNTYLTVLVLFFILIASSSTNLVANYIPTQNSLLNFFPSSLNLKSSAFIIGFVGSFVGIFWIPLLSQIGILSFIDTVSSFFGPIAGVMIVDYYVIKKKQLINKDIFSPSKDGKYYYTGGWHIKAIYAIFVGFVFASATIWNVNLMFLQPFSWLIGTISSSLTYYFLNND
jgi:nucleobase:cation symporter-1, NCS1 family